MNARPGRLALAVLTLACAVAAPCVRAAPDAKAQGEIDHLLAFVAASGCTFYRGGSAYPADEAAKHLALKYDTARPMLATADQFVERVASASSMTGQPYRVACGGAPPGPSRDWLRGELKRYRADGAKAQ